MKTLTKVFAVLVVSSSALTARPQGLTPSWTEPPDAMISKAIDDGFSGGKIPKAALYHEIIAWKIQPEPNSRITITPPLLCAFQSGRKAHDELTSKPSVAMAKTACLRHLSVLIVHYSQQLGKNWPCVFEKPDGLLQPATKVLDDNPQVENYYAGFVAMDQVGYAYYDSYSFEIPEKWPDVANLVYADDYGVHHTVTVNFSVFSKDVAGRS